LAGRLRVATKIESTRSVNKCGSSFILHLS
jgi:hypothetical protein